MNRIKQTTAIFLFILVFGMPASLHAAAIFFETKTGSVSPGQDFRVNVFLNTEGEEVNAIEGKVAFPRDLLELKEIQDGNSVITFWIEKPKLRQGAIFFSGVTPGGFSGQKEQMLSLIFRAKKAGNALIDTDGIRVLRNDGEGTETKITVKNLELRILNAGAGKVIADNTAPKDILPPEDFKPVIISDLNFFGGKQVLIFATQDKGSGIDHYEVREGKVGWFSVSDSPYLLKHQWLDRVVFVKAVDRAGNERTAIFLPPHPQKIPKDDMTVIFGIIIMSLILAALLIRRTRKGRRKI